MTMQTNEQPQKPTVHLRIEAVSLRRVYQLIRCVIWTVIIQIALEVWFVSQFGFNTAIPLASALGTAVTLLIYFAVIGKNPQHTRMYDLWWYTYLSPFIVIMITAVMVALGIIHTEPTFCIATMIIQPSILLLVNAIRR